MISVALQRKLLFWKPPSSGLKAHMTDITGAAVPSKDGGYVEKKKRRFKGLIKENRVKKWISDG